jgi:hypothetical protein
VGLVLLAGGGFQVGDLGRAAVTSSALVFAWPLRPRPASGTSVSSTQVRGIEPEVGLFVDHA